MSEVAFLYPRREGSLYPEVDTVAADIVAELRARSFHVHGVSVIGVTDGQCEYVKSVSWRDGRVWLGFGRPQGTLDGRQHNNAGLRYVAFHGRARAWREDHLMRLALYPLRTVGPALYVATRRIWQWDLGSFLEGGCRPRTLRYAGFCLCSQEEGPHKPHRPDRVASDLRLDKHVSYLEGRDASRQAVGFAPRRPGDPSRIATAIAFDEASANMARLLGYIVSA